jgi:hypothetical protein
MSRFLLLVLLGLLSVACSTSDKMIDDGPRYNNEPGALDLIICEEPRPQICTNEYDPVCATLQDDDVKTYATGCTSCSDPKVQGYKKGACGVVSLD